MNWKLFFGVVCPLLLVLVCTGCSGINASKSISPATFLLPGLMKADPPVEQKDVTLPPNDAAPIVARN